MWLPRANLPQDADLRKRIGKAKIEDDCHAQFHIVIRHIAAVYGYIGAKRCNCLNQNVFGITPRAFATFMTTC
jgi:hypothetical protein